MSGTGIELITSARPRIAAAERVLAEDASSRTSWTRSEGSSSYIAISSSTTSRSESISG